MSDLTEDVVLVGALGAGAAMQMQWGGPWLLMLGTIALGYRASFGREDRRTFMAMLAASVLWYLLHFIIGLNLKRMGQPMPFSDLAAEALVFLAFPPLFWFARITRQKRIALEQRKLDGLKESSGNMGQLLESVRAELDRLTQESEGWTKLFGVTRDIGEVMRESEMAGIIQEAVKVHLRMPAYIVLTAHDGMLRISADKGFDEAVLQKSAFSVSTSSLATWFLRQREPILVDNLEADGRFAGISLPFKSIVAMPMWVRENPLGVLVAFDDSVRTFTRQDFTRAWILGKQLALGIGKALLYETVEQLSITDGLTHLYCHRYFHERLGEELERSRRYGRPVSFLMGDLDHFKEFNDTFGHLEGDEVLKLAARVMENEFKKPALLARYGGEEFAVLLPGFDRETAASVAEKFREVLSRARYSGTEPRPPVTISVGVATFPQDAQTSRDLIDCADAALYQAKSQGRNRVCVFDPAKMSMQRAN